MTREFRNPRLDGNYENLAAEREAEKCVFCDLRPKYVITQNELATLTVNIFPYTNGQLLVIPHRHIVTLDEITNDEVLAIHDLSKFGANLLRDRLGIENFWLILRDGNSSGKTIKHLHNNILPYNPELNTWHHQEITIPPIDLAEKLRG